MALGNRALESARHRLRERNIDAEFLTEIYDVRIGRCMHADRANRVPVVPLRNSLAVAPLRKQRPFCGAPLRMNNRDPQA